MVNKIQRFGLLKSSVLGVAAFSMAIFSAPAALAGGGYGGDGYGRHGGYSSQFRGHGRNYYGGRGYRGGRSYYGGRGYYRGRGFRNYGYGYRGRGYRRGYGRISAGEGALIAAGIIGGVILIDQAIKADRREYYERRRYQERYDDRRRGAFDGDDPYYRRGERSDQGREFNRDDRTQDGENKGIDGDLLGGQKKSVGYTLQTAFNECTAETRGAAGAGGLMVALPSEPTSVKELDDGSIRLTVDFTAQNPRGRQWRRTMTCEADAGGIKFLEIA